jgi:hypothetical protein
MIKAGLTAYEVTPYSPSHPSMRANIVVPAKPIWSP